jgi:biotin-[acetyl-CoA-carboxylase] ligase BirA-like protein
MPSSRDISKYDIYYYNEVNSTMDKAKDMIKGTPNIPLFSVIAGSQNKGRGTRGRTWLSSSAINGNLYMTVVFKMSAVPVPLTLMPLRVATLIAPCIQRRITSSSSLYLKWPNDVLIDNEKVCGILIEIDDDNVVVGIGCNVCEAPTVDSNGAEAGRVSTCLSKHNKDILNNVDYDSIVTNTDNKVETLLETHPPLLGLAVDIVEAIDIWLQNKDTPSSVLKDFEEKMTTATQRIRTDRLVDQSLLGKEVLPLRLNNDGSLVVRVIDDNRDTTLVADYLW